MTDLAPCADCKALTRDTVDGVPLCNDCEDERVRLESAALDAARKARNRTVTKDCAGWMLGSGSRVKARKP